MPNALAVRGHGGRPRSASSSRFAATSCAPSSAPRAGSRATAVTSQPAASRSAAIARPIPDDAPVTMRARHEPIGCHAVFSSSVRSTASSDCAGPGRAVARHVRRAAPLELGVAGGVDQGVDVGVARERRPDLGAGPGQEVDDATGDVAGAEHLLQVEPGRAGTAPTPARSTVLPPASAAQSGSTRPASAGSSGATSATTPTGSGTREREVRLRHLVHAAEHARQLVGPAGVVDGGLDAGGELGARGAGRHARWTPRSTLASSSVRASSTSASRYRIWPRL